MKAEGLKLKELLESEGANLQDIYEGENKVMSRSTLYYYFGQKKIKKDIVQRILNKVKIPLDKFYTVETTNTEASDPVSTYTISYHQGKNLKTYLDSKGVSITHFANAMNVSRPTVYSYFEEKELPIGTLLEAAYVLNVPVATLKGRGTGEKSFEKDIYLEIKSINDKLTTLLKFANSR